MTAELHPQFRFDELVVGPSNRLAVTAARAVAESPGTVYNPLFVYSAPGLGKTHLLTAIGHAARAIDARTAVEYVTLDEFVEGFTEALASGEGDAHRRRFLDVGVLLLDDVQFLAGRREMQSELLRVIDGMQAAGRQVVLACDRPPQDIAALDERLALRFGGGLVVDIGAPEYETRMAILRRRAEQRDATFEAGVLEAVAEADIGSVRELLGALNRLIALQAVSDAPIAPSDAGELVPRARAASPGVEAASDLEVPGGGLDEFSDFLQEVTATVSQQVESWRTRIADAMLRWEGEGYRVARLAALLDREEVDNPARELAHFEADIARLVALRAQVEQLAPDLAAAGELRDPDQLDAAEAVLARAMQATEPPPPPSAHWTLDAFLESAGNRVAVRAARAAAEAPGSRYNPLVIAGGSGNGKTHLLHAIGNALATDGRVVACSSTQVFVDELIAAIDGESIARWRTRWRRPDALLLDDIQLLAGKERTQEELFLLFNAFLESGRQMVFASARPLADLEDIESRLVTRFEGGLVVELPPPDRELRQRAIERELAARLDAVDPELATYLASRPADSMRATLGIVQRVLQAADARDAAPTAVVAREVLEGKGARPAGRRSSVVRSSGIVPPGTGVARNREKMVWEWPETASRLVEEWR